jgi:predicted regulator of Ras-like GTPase activity (Roadblock/LC7/MglB family)
MPVGTDTTYTRSIQMPRSILEEVSESFQSKIPGFRAIAMVNLDGSITDHVSVDPGVDNEMLAEFATLVRIADRTSEDAASGELFETSWISDQSTILTRRISEQSFLIFVGEPLLLTGLARYLLRQAAWQLHAELESTSR